MRIVIGAGIGKAGGEHGCGLYFCGTHKIGEHQQCERCLAEAAPFPAKPDHPDWIRHKLTDESWLRWRAENVLEVLKLQGQLDALPSPEQA